MNKDFFVYMFLDVNEVPLYIGRTINLVSRIEVDHFGSEYGNLSLECIKETDRVLYHKAVSLDDMKIKERYLINTLKPKYNKSLNNESRFSFNIDFTWNLYSIDKIKLIEKQKKRSPKKGVNYNCVIEKTTNSWLPYGFSFQNKKIKYLAIKPLEKNITIEERMEGTKISYFIKINDNIYINNHYNLGYYIAHYRELCKTIHLDKKLDFLSISAPVDNKLFKYYPEDKDYEHLEGVSFMRYDIVKHLEIFDQKTISLYDKRLNTFYKSLKEELPKVQ